MFQDGRRTVITSVSSKQASERDGAWTAAITPEGHVPQSLYPASYPHWQSDGMPFPFNNFTCCFTLFSKCFSSFHHCTCSLSVSRLYLALDGIYHPLWAAFPNNSTRRERLIRSRGPCRTGFSPSVTSCSKEHRHGRLQDAIFKLQLPGGISNLSFCRFTRRYWGNPCWFLFLRLLICLSSAGSPTWFEEKKMSVLTVPFCRVLSSLFSCKHNTIRED